MHNAKYRFGADCSIVIVCKRLSTYPVSRVADVRGTESGDQTQRETIIGVETAEEAHASNKPS